MMSATPGHKVGRNGKTWRTGLTVASNAEMLAEWDAERNPPADSVAIGSNKKCWWRCSDGHGYQISPAVRIRHLATRGTLTQCPTCYKATQRVWSWDEIVKQLKATTEEIGYLPPAQWFSANGYSSMVNAIYTKHAKTWADARTAVESLEGGSLAPSRSGVLWRSKAEACLSDFLWARGIDHGRGRKYTKSYAKASGKKYGVYDLRFHSPVLDEEIDVEVWGGHPAGKAVEYDRVRAEKERYHEGDPRFLGLEHTDCYSEKKLKDLLRPFIGERGIVRFGNDLDRAVPSVRWTEAPDVLERCRALAAAQPDGAFPSESWLRKLHRFANREGPSYTTLADQVIRCFGGVPNVRKLLGQSGDNRFKWNYDIVLVELKKWMEQYGRTPMRIVGAFRRGSREVPEAEVRRGSLINTMAAKYCGGVNKALLELGYDIKPIREKSSALELLHGTAREIKEIALSDPDPERSERLQKLVKKIYLYGGQLQDGRDNDG